MTDWNEVVGKHGPIVWKTAWRLLGDYSDTSDCYQKVFLEAVQVSKRQTVHNWPGLLRRLATVRALDVLRSRYRSNNRTHALSSPDSIIGNEPGPQEQAADSEMKNCLREALTQLPSRQAEVFCAVALEGLTYKEVAERLNLDRSAVGMLLHRARTSLRKDFAALAPNKSAEARKG